MDAYSAMGIALISLKRLQLAAKGGGRDRLVVTTGPLSGRGEEGLGGKAMKPNRNLNLQ
jgi:hypothetical protein